MGTEDAFGYELSIDDPIAAAAWDKAVQAFLAHSAATPAHLAAALETAPNFAMATLAKGYFMLLLGRGELIPTAEAAYAEATRLKEAMTPRERAYHEGLGLYLAGAMTAAADRLDAALARWPRDALMVKLTHAIRFVLGDAPGMRRSLEAVLHAYRAEHPASGYINGCYAFALEETGEYMAAERRGRDALAIAPDDAWGLHAVAHVYDMTNRATEGVAWIRRQPQAWAHCNNFGYHVWWHLALFHLDRGEHAHVLALYDDKIRADKTDDYRDISNAASLLSRLELEGVAVGDRWDELAALAGARADDGCVVFADLHYLLALNGPAHEDHAAALLASMRARAERDVGCMDQVAAAAGLPAAQGLHAFSNGDYARAYAHLARARPQMLSVGGSHAQRDVFERITIEAALRAGLLDDAQRVLHDRTRRRGALDRYAETRLAKLQTLRAAAQPVAAA